MCSTAASPHWRSCMSEKMFPLFLDISQKHFLVYGGGTIASRRIGVLSSFGAKITVISPEISDKIKSLCIDWKAETFCPQSMPVADFVLCATNDMAVNHQIVALCRQKNIPVNNASDQSECDFHFPAIAQKDALVVGLNAAGTDHKLVKSVAQKIRHLLEELC